MVLFLLLIITNAELLRNVQPSSALPGNSLIKAIQHPLLVAAPGRCDEKLLRAVTRHAMHDDILRKCVKSLYDEGSILLHRRELPRVLFINTRKLRAAKNLQKLKLHAEHAAGADITNRSKHILLRLTGPV